MSSVRYSTQSNPSKPGPRLLRRPIISIHYPEPEARIPPRRQKMCPLRLQSATKFSIVNLRFAALKKLPELKALAFVHALILPYPYLATLFYLRKQRACLFLELDGGQVLERGTRGRRRDVR